MTLGDVHINVLPSFVTVGFIKKHLGIENKIKCNIQNIEHASPMACNFRPLNSSFKGVYFYTRESPALLLQSSYFGSNTSAENTARVLLALTLFLITIHPFQISFG